ncbi:MAG: RNA polymerase sigma factor [Acidimicrobiia bacterium]|nr:RNA polymerase sigma factor [Acidimicrobiia bacterium]
MLRVAGGYVGSRATAEDVVQETWLAVLRGVDRFDGRSPLKTWIFRILTNRAKTAGQREARTVVVADIVEPAVPRRPGSPAFERLLNGGHERIQHRKTPEPQQPTTDDRLIAYEAVGLVVAAINELPPAQRLVITLRDVDCWSAQEVCDGLGLSEANQRVLLHRARAKVRAQCAHYLTSAS